MRRAFIRIANVLLLRFPMMRIVDGQRAPRYMGLAWYDHYRDFAVMMPIPLNIVAGQLRRIYSWARNPWGGTRTSAEQRCFEKGYRAGRYERDILGER